MNKAVSTSTLISSADFLSSQLFAIIERVDIYLKQIYV